MSQLVEQGEPEIVEPVVAQGQTDHRTAGGQLHGCAIEMGMWQVALQRQMDARLAEKLFGKARAGFQITELSEFPQKTDVHRAGAIGRQVLLEGEGGHADSPCSEGVGIVLAAITHALTVEGGRQGCFTERLHETPEQFFELLLRFHRRTGESGKPAALHHLRNWESPPLLQDFIGRQLRSRLL